MTDSDREAESEVKQQQALADAGRGTACVNCGAFLYSATEIWKHRCLLDLNAEERKETVKRLRQQQRDPAELLTLPSRLIGSTSDYSYAAAKMVERHSTPRRSLVFDVETAALPNAAEFLEPVEPPSNYRDPAVIARYRADKQREQLDRAALDPDLARIVAIGAWDGQSVPWIEVARNDNKEVNLLVGFWIVVRGAHLVGYNCLAFDLPVLIRRSQYLGIPVPKLDLSKYRHEGITDLQQELLFNREAKTGRSLNWYCKRFGIDVPDPLTGADIAGAVAAGNWSAVESHLAADLRKTATLANKLGLFAEVK